RRPARRARVARSRSPWSRSGGTPPPAGRARLLPGARARSPSGPRGAARRRPRPPRLPAASRATAWSWCRSEGRSSRALRSLDPCPSRLGREVWMVLEAVPDDGALRRLHLVETPDDLVVRRRLRELRVLLGLACDREHRVGER